MTALPWALAVVSAVALAVAIASRRRLERRLARLREGVGELVRGNLGHRMMLPGDDAAALLGEELDSLAETMQSQREEAARRETARRRLFEDVSHDLRTPITSIAGYVDALRRGLGGEPERYLAILSGKTEELASLTDDLFYAARLEAGELTFRIRTVDVAEIVRQTVLGFEPQLRGLSVDVGLDIPDAPCLADADESALRRILGNVMSNAVRHAQGMRRFHVSLQSAEDGWRVTIANDGDGLGMPAEDVFVRGSSEAGGTGLGLAISRELAKRLSASLTAEEPPQGGVAFVLSLPAAESAAERVCS